MKVRSIPRTQAFWMSFLSLAEKIPAWSSSFGFVKAYIGATRAFSKFKADSLERSCFGTIFTLKKTTQGSHFESCHQTCASPNVRCFARNSFSVYNFGKGSQFETPFCKLGYGVVWQDVVPLRTPQYQVSSNRSRVFTVYGASIPIGSYTAETRLNSLSDSMVVSGVVPRQYS